MRQKTLKPLHFDNLFPIFKIYIAVSIPKDQCKRKWRKVKIDRF